MELLSEIQNSNLSEHSKKSLLLILDKAIGDADIVARLEDELKLHTQMEWKWTRAGLQKILDGDKPE